MTCRRKEGREGRKSWKKKLEIRPKNKKNKGESVAEKMVEGIEDRGIKEREEGKNRGKREYRGEEKRQKEKSR